MIWLRGAGVSTCPEDSYVMCDIPSTPASEVVTHTTVVEPLPATGYDPTLGLSILSLGLALITVGIILTIKRGFRRDQ